MPEHAKDEMNDNPEQPAGNDPGPEQEESGGPEAAEQGEGERVTLPYVQFEELKTLARERDEYLRRLQRSVADYQNLQKRIDRLRDMARVDILRSLGEAILPVADDLARALESARSVEGCEAIVQGLELVDRSFYSALAKLGIEPVDAEGQEFDPRYHEATAQFEQADAPPNTVIKELKKGFVLGDIVLRPSQVVVAVAPASPSEDGSG